MPSAAVGSESFAPAEAQRYQIEANDKSFVSRAAPKWVLGVAAALLLISGSYDSIISKLMNRQQLAPCEGCEVRYFEAPFFQTLTMYIGESLCLIAYYLDRYFSNRNNKSPKFDFPSSDKSFAKPPCPKYLWIIPTVFDFAASSAINYAMVFEKPSTVQLLRNFNIIVTAVLTVLYIKMGLRRHQILGVIVVTLGLILTGINALMGPADENNYAGMAWVGILLAVGGTILSAFQFVFEESLFRKYSASPLEAVGLMGVFGIAIGVVLLLILQFTGVEKTSETFYMMGAGNHEAGIVIMANVTFVISVSIFNASGLMVTKLASGILRTILIAARTFSIWAIELIIQWSPFQVIQFLGLLVVLLGTLVYNYNYFFPRDSWKGDRPLRKAMICCGARDPDAEEEELREESVIATSDIVDSEPQKGMA